MASRTWYLFIYQIPPKPLYLRAKIRQRLLRAGAVPLKKSAYAVPAERRLLEPLREIERATEEGGGEAYICEARFVDESTEQELLGKFQEERRRDYEQLVAEARRAPTSSDAVRKLRGRLEEIRGIDFFSSPAGKDAAAALDDLETHAGAPKRGAAKSPFRSSTWATRAGVGIDRVASAWLVRRFIDPQARFRFIESGGRPPRGAVTFDMPGGDVTHDAGRCTFEVLLASAGLRDAALKRIGEIVHDVDLRDRKYKRPEAAGVEQLISGIVRSNADDATRLERGFALFDDLYEAFRKS